MARPAICRTSFQHLKMVYVVGQKDMKDTGLQSQDSFFSKPRNDVSSSYIIFFGNGVERAAIQLSQSLNL